MFLRTMKQWRTKQYPSLFAWTYQPAYQLESTVFFSHNKSAWAGLSIGFNTSRTGLAEIIVTTPMTNADKISYSHISNHVPSVNIDVAIFFLIIDDVPC